MTMVNMVHDHDNACQLLMAVATTMFNHKQPHAKLKHQHSPTLITTLPTLFTAGYLLP
jgi:hypothetical protein